MCPVFTLDYEISTWKPAVYETAAATFRVVNEIQSGAKLTLMARLWKLERLLRSFLNEINEPTTTTAETRKPVTEVDVKWAIGALGDLGQSLEEMYTNAKRLRLTNGTFIGPVLDSIRTQ